MLGECSPVRGNPSQRAVQAGGQKKGLGRWMGRRASSLEGA